MNSRCPSRRDVVSHSAALGAVLGVSAPKTAEAAVQVGTERNVSHKTVSVDGVDIFYREAGPADAPVLLLLHGFANSSHYFRHLMPVLSHRFRLVAPDMPSFGFTVVPPERRYVYDFAGLSKTMIAFVDALGLKRFAIYMFDYGAPVGFNLALARPERVTGIVSQNGNAYEEGLGEEGWAAPRAFWKERTTKNRNALRSRFTFEAVRDTYRHGVADPGLIEPEAYWLDATLLARPGMADIQLDLKLDYDANIARYPLFQAFLRERQPPLLAIWGRNDLFFIPPGAEAFRRDVPATRIRMLDTGHFALETHLDVIAAEILETPFRA